jgi:uncharacterized protein YukE
MTDSAQQPVSGDAQASPQLDLAEEQERIADAFARACEVMATAAQALRQSQTELSCLKAAQTAKFFELPKFGGDSSVALPAQYDQWRENSEKLIAHMRMISDLACECGWQLFRIYAVDLRRDAKSTQLPSL